MYDKLYLYYYAIISLRLKRKSSYINYDNIIAVLLFNLCSWQVH